MNILDILKNRKTRKQLKIENERMSKTLTAKNNQINDLTKELSLKSNEFEELQEKSKKENNRLEKILSKKEQELFKVEKLLENEVEKNAESVKEKNELEIHLKQLQGTKGGLTAENNKLKKEVEELTKKLEESMSDKYRVKKIPSGKPPKGERIRIKKVIKNSQVQKILNEKTLDEIK